jgi:beta-galactosidase/beta-glucuronidase
MTADPKVHPRPQLTRPGWIDLCGEWGFAYDDADAGLQAGWPDAPEPFDRTIIVPFPPESTASGIADRGYHPVVWYRRTFRADQAPDHRLLLHFGAVDYRAQVWVNGQLVATHEGGHTPFHADITEAVRPGEDNVIVVRAEDDPHDFEQPRGKQDWQLHPHRIWYDRTTGIWQPVWLESVPATHVTSVRWTPDITRSSLHLEVSVRRTDDRPLRARVRLTLQDQLLADDTYPVGRTGVRRDIGLEQAGMTLSRRDVLWAPEYPNLIDAEITLLDESGQPVDEVASYTAMRSIEAADGRVLLNGRPYFLRLVLAQGFWPESHLASPSAEALRREVELTKALGFNGVRLHQKLEDPRFLYWCDRLGLLVWAEMPAAYEFSPKAIGRLTREWIEAIERDYSHPCVIAWVPINESWGVPSLDHSPAQRDAVRALYHLTKTLDPTRLAIGNDGWEQIVSDLLTVHDYASDPAVLKERYGSRDAVDTTMQHVQPGYRKVLVRGHTLSDEPVIISEFGGITFNPELGDTWPGYGAVGTREELRDRYCAIVDALIDSPALTGFCYTQLTDTQQERNGLLTENREPKIDPRIIRTINRRTAASVPGDAIDAFEFGDYPSMALDPAWQATTDIPAERAESPAERSS